MNEQEIMNELVDYAQQVIKLKQERDTAVRALEVAKVDCELRQESGDCGNYELADDKTWVLITETIKQIKGE